MIRPTRLLALAAAALLVAACSGQDTTTSAGTSAEPTAQVAAGGPQTPDAGGAVVEVRLLTDEQGNNRFDPAEVTARPGDVVRYTLGSGVHNVHFLPDSNPGVSGLPGASDMLQLPGQTYDLKVTLAPGRYYFQCDPHALLGMVGHLTVVER
ncbi:MAG TPA: plastocyanin/azurin family copper-binding protein [Gemmatimonadaceae bacterium]|nr:plastocyanin/azurin family copper-binding protein [Gemmatimonadaceae bacterium]